MGVAGDVTVGVAVAVHMTEAGGVAGIRRTLPPVSAEPLTFLMVLLPAV